MKGLLSGFYVMFGNVLACSTGVDLCSLKKINQAVA